MITRKIFFSSFDNKKLNLVQWKPEGNVQIKGVLQLVHGMAEHIRRYETLAKVFCDNGYLVYGHDQRGHGSSIEKDGVVGYISDKEGWDYYIDDVNSVTKLINEENPNLPIFIIGHSMGSIVVSSYRQKYDNPNVKGFILSALPFEQNLLSSLGIGVANIQKIFKGGISKGKLHNFLSFSAFNKPFKPNRTEFDWLSRDEKEVDKYIADPRCGAVFTVQFFNDMLNGLKSIYSKENLKKINKNIPVLFFAGTDDPVAGGPKKFDKTKETLSKYSTDLSTKIYKSGRHEMLNETNREEVMNDILNWVNSKNN